MSRSHETMVTIDAPIEQVWKALTEPAQITRWFAPHMEVRPGVGGTHTADWGQGVVWKTAIEVWEPLQHLRLVETRDRVLSASTVEEQLEPCRLVQDFYLETASGKTVVRLVHSGFGTSEAWDKEYEGTRGGWAACFLRLKHAVEIHPNDRVDNSMITAQWDGVDAVSGKARLRAQMPASFQEKLAGKYEFAGLLPDLNGSIVNVSVQPSPTGCVAYLELLLFGLSEGSAAQVKEQFEKKLADQVPA